MLRMIKKIGAIILVGIFLLLNLPTNVSATTQGNHPEHWQSGYPV